jgi:hypothetical protein
MQVVRDYLLHGPVDIVGVRYATVADYYFGISKRIQRGHWCNASLPSVKAVLGSPTLTFNGYLLNNQCAIICDIVHWGLSDYANKRAALKGGVQLEVRSLVF